MRRPAELEMKPARPEVESAATFARPAAAPFNMHSQDISPLCDASKIYLSNIVCKGAATRIPDPSPSD
jgi:hypothetical protein